MEQRDNRRFARRVEIRFWRRGETQGHSAFTTNVSRTGLFLGTAMALLPGERLRLEIVGAEQGFVVEGVVARVHRVSLALRQVSQAGVGVRFLTPDELIAGLLPDSGRVAHAGAAVPAPPAPPAPPAGPVPAAGAEAEVEKAVPANGKIVPVSFGDASAFLSVFHRDIQFGGLFLSTEDPGDLNEVVWVELEVPLDGVRALTIPSRVVQRFEPEAAVGGGRNLLAGMAVQFLDPEKVVSELRPLLPRLRG